MKIGVVIFPGSNCDHDIIYVLHNILKQEVVELWHKTTDLQGCDLVVLPGGFSYGDYLRSGAIARLSPIMNNVIEFANKGGYVIGICNGFQVLTEAKLLEGALLHNNNQKFICKNQFITPQTNNTIFTKEAQINKAYKIPIAHGEGRFFADEETLKRLNDNDQILFRYCDEKGNITPESNPNGSLENIAGITNKTRNVFGMMPHPERGSDEELGNTDGRLFFESIIKNIK
ncbi:MAG: phosphoribosylformylglycinamidine synthase subunit PurQ [Bacteroidales bacterium]|nr:phosphoribosylformylglycinamidine synthase subunit PurQ [Bacteroidales bacterium]MDD4830314.1 phosphoribosylformylglycinamidine synthase subunit PurQ [Bacteroidales bacterium]